MGRNLISFKIRKKIFFRNFRPAAIWDALARVLITVWYYGGHIHYTFSQRLDLGEKFEKPKSQERFFSNV